MTRKTSRFVEMERDYTSRRLLWRGLLIGTPIALVLWLLIFEVVR